MSSHFLAIARLLLLPLFLWASYYLYWLSIGFFSEFIQIHFEGALVIVALLAREFLAVALVSLLFCYPLAALYQKSAVGVSIGMSAIVIVPQLPVLINFNTNLYHPFVFALAAYELLAYMALMVVCTSLACKHLARSNITVERDASPQSGSRLSP